MIGASRTTSMPPPAAFLGGGTRMGTSVPTTPLPVATSIETPNQHFHDSLKPLLLEGDEFFVSHDGVSRTYYELERWSTYRNSITPVALEEFYDLKGARKTFIVRKDASADVSSHDDVHSSVLGTNVEGIARLGTPIDQCELQEIDQGVFGSAGTGSTTWESSIAMSLFFSSNPGLLRGNVVELGSGVGLTGLLSQMASSSLIEMESLTLTDGNTDVLEQCQRNLDRVHSSRIPFRVECLDWYDYADEKKSALETYDTVLASDCAYLYPDIVALSRTMTALCRKDQESRIHIFGPYNRGALHELITELRDQLNLNVILDWIEMKRYRLKPIRGLTHSSFPDLADMRSQHEKECDFASKNTAKFLHISAWHKDSNVDKESEVKPSLVDID